MPIDAKILQRLRDNDKTFTCLSVLGNQLKEVSKKELLYLPQVEKFTFKSLGVPDLNVYDRKILVQALAQNSTLTWLRLLGTYVHSAMLRQLARAIAQNNTLTFLDLSSNDIRDEGAKDLALALTQNKTLTSLSLGKNRISMQGAKQLSQALLINASLTKLSLWKNEIGDEGARELARAIAKNKILTWLDIEHNKIGDEGIKELASALTQNSNLVSLNLGRNRITDIGAKELATALTQNNNLISLSLECNYISDLGAKVLVQILNANVSLLMLQLRDETGIDCDLYYLSKNLLERNKQWIENLVATSLITLRLGRLLLYKVTSSPQEVSFFTQLPLEIKERIFSEASNTKKVLTKEQQRLILSYAQGKIAPAADKLTFFRVTKCDRVRKQNEVEAASRPSMFMV